MNIIVIFYCPKSLKISHDYGLVSVRIFYKNNLIFFVLSTRILLKGKLRFIKLLWNKIRHLATNPRPNPLHRRPSLLLSLPNEVTLVQS